MHDRWNRWNWSAPKNIATTKAVFCVVRIIIIKETTQARYLFLTVKGRKQKLIFSYLLSPVNLKIQIMTMGIQPMLKK